MRFVVDAQLPPALARWLTAKGHEAEHVADRRMEAATDGVIWAYAIEAAAAIVTKDEDFARRKVLAEERRDLLAWFETVLPDVLSTIERGETLIELT